MAFWLNRGGLSRSLVFNQKVKKMKIVKFLSFTSLVMAIMSGTLCIISSLHFLGHVQGNGECFDCNRTTEDVKIDTIKSLVIFLISAAVFFASSVIAYNKNKTIKL